MLQLWDKLLILFKFWFIYVENSLKILNTITFIYGCEYNIKNSISLLTQYLAGTGI